MKSNKRNGGEQKNDLTGLTKKEAKAYFKKGIEMCACCDKKLTQFQVNNSLLLAHAELASEFFGILNGIPRDECFWPSSTGETVYTNGLFLMLNDLADRGYLDLDAFWEDLGICLGKGGKHE